MEILELHPKVSNERQRGLILIPLDKIEKVESLVGSENCYCKINGIEIEESYLEIKNLLSSRY